jgi:hypothetical protein
MRHKHEITLRQGEAEGEEELEEKVKLSLAQGDVHARDISSLGRPLVSLNYDTTMLEGPKTTPTSVHCFGSSRIHL